MTKKELSVALGAQSLDVESNAAAERIVNIVFNTVKHALEKGEIVDIAGFGKFSTKLQKSKTGTIPGTKKKYTTQDKMVPAFKFGKAVKDAVANGK